MRIIRSPCCARAAAGHAAPPPGSVMNSRRRTRYLAEPSRQDRRCVRDKRTSAACRTLAAGLTSQLSKFHASWKHGSVQCKKATTVHEAICRRRLAWAEPGLATETSDASRGPVWVNRVGFAMSARSLLFSLNTRHLPNELARQFGADGGTRTRTTCSAEGF